MATLLLIAGVAAGCGSGGSTTAFPTPGSDADAGSTINETVTSRGGSRPRTTNSPSRTATTRRGAVSGSSPGDNGGVPSKDGAGATPGRGPSAGDPSATNGGPNTTGPGTTRPTTKPTGGPTKPPGDETTRSGGGRTYPGPNAEPTDAAVIPGRGPGVGPPILPPELVAHYDRIYGALPAKSPEVMRQTEDVVRLTSEAPPESKQAVTGDAAILVAAAEEVSRTGNIAKYEEPQVRAAYQNMKAEQARVPAGVGSVDAR